MNNLNYTDQHDVDEDVRTIGKQGGRWIAEAGNGVCLRHLIDDIASEQDLVASRQKIIYLLPRRKEV